MKNGPITPWKGVDPEIPDGRVGLGGAMARGVAVDAVVRPEVPLAAVEGVAIEGREADARRAREGDVPSHV